MFVTLNVDFHVETPIYCSNADGIITYYVLFSLDDNGHLHGNIRGWYFHFSGGSTICAQSIKNDLRNQIPGAIGDIQNLIDLELASQQNNQYSELYLLPGHGGRSNSGHDNADNNVALALIPRPSLAGIRPIQAALNNRPPL